MSFSSPSITDPNNKASSTIEENPIIFGPLALAPYLIYTFHHRLFVVIQSQGNSNIQSLTSALSANIHPRETHFSIPKTCIYIHINSFFGSEVKETLAMEPDYFGHEQDENDFEAEIPLDEGEEEEAQMTAVSGNPSTEEELENVKKKLKEIEEETGNLRQKSALIEKEIGGAAQGHENSAGASDDGQSEKEEADSRSIYVGNVDYECTPEEVQHHFQSCGTVNRVTILTDQFGQPKGFAYVEFVETEAVQNAIMLNESELHGRQLKVMRKRTNIPGMKQHRGRPFFRRGFMPGPPSYQSNSYGRSPRYRRPVRYSPY